MNALVTGGAGFIGSAIAKALIGRGDRVRILDSFITGFESNVPDGAEVVRADLRDFDAVMEACEGAEIVFHQAAFKSVPKSLEDPLLSESSNAAGTLHVLMSAERQNVQRVVYASSSSAYGEATEGVKQEDMAATPISPYGVSKLAGEHYCRVWARLKGLSTISLRYFNVFGPGQHPASTYSAVFPAFVSALHEGRAPQVFGDGEQSRDFTFIDDVVAANLRAADVGEEANGSVMNVCAGSPRTVNEVLRSVSEAMGTWIEPNYLSRRPMDILHSHGDRTRAAALLGWTPQADWKESVNKTVAWLIEAARRER